MTKFYDTKENIMMCAGFNDPQPHKHLMAHIIVSLGRHMIWNIEGEDVICRGICIDYDTIHMGRTAGQGSLVFLYARINSYGQSLKKRLLKDTKYYVLYNEIVDEVCRKYWSIEKIRSEAGKENSITDEELFDELMKICGLNKNEECIYDNRIKEILPYIENKETIFW